MSPATSVIVRRRDGTVEPSPGGVVARGGGDATTRLAEVKPEAGSAPSTPSARIECRDDAGAGGDAVMDARTETGAVEDGAAPAKQQPAGTQSENAGRDGEGTSASHHGGPSGWQPTRRTRRPCAGNEETGGKGAADTDAGAALARRGYGAPSSGRGRLDLAFGSGGSSGSSSAAPARHSEPRNRGAAVRSDAGERSLDQAPLTGTSEGGSRRAVQEWEDMSIDANAVQADAAVAPPPAGLWSSTPQEVTATPSIEITRTRIETRPLGEPPLRRQQKLYMHDSTTGGDEAAEAGADAAARRSPAHRGPRDDHRGRGVGPAEPGERRGPQHRAACARLNVDPREDGGGSHETAEDRHSRPHLRDDARGSILRDVRSHGNPVGSEGKHRRVGSPCEEPCERVQVGKDSHSSRCQGKGRADVGAGNDAPARHCRSPDDPLLLGGRGRGVDEQRGPRREHPPPPGAHGSAQGRSAGGLQPGAALAGSSRDQGPPAAIWMAPPLWLYLPSQGLVGHGARVEERGMDAEMRGQLGDAGAPIRGQQPMPGRDVGCPAEARHAPAAGDEVKADRRRRDPGRGGAASSAADAYVLNADLARHGERVLKRRQEQRRDEPLPGLTASERMAALRRRVAERHSAVSGGDNEGLLIRDSRVGGLDAAGAVSSNEHGNMHLAPAAVPRRATDTQRAGTAAAAAARRVAWHALDETPRAD